MAKDQNLCIRMCGIPMDRCLTVCPGVGQLRAARFAVWPPSRAESWLVFHKKGTRAFSDATTRLKRGRSGVILRALGIAVVCAFHR